MISCSFRKLLLQTTEWKVLSFYSIFILTLYFRAISIFYTCEGLYNWFTIFFFCNKCHNHSKTCISHPFLFKFLLLININNTCFLWEKRTAINHSCQSWIVTGRVYRIATFTDLENFLANYNIVAVTATERENFFHAKKLLRKSQWLVKAVKRN